MGESYNKLVRDNVPEILISKGLKFEERIATPEEFEEELIKKLGEEINEFQIEGDIEELADIIEVIEALKEIPRYKDVLTIRDQKRKERGGFDKRLILAGEKE